MLLERCKFIMLSMSNQVIVCIAQLMYLKCKVGLASPAIVQDGELTEAYCEFKCSYLTLLHGL